MATLTRPPEQGPRPTAKPTTAGANSRVAFCAVWFGSWVLRLLMSTLHLRVEFSDEMRARLAAEPFIFIFWHNRLLLIPIVWNRILQAEDRPRGMALTSLSKDGEMVALFLERFRVGAVRGSATRRGAGAVRELAGWLKRGHDVGITPDGSRGPCYEIKPGLVLLAQLSGRAILPLNFEFSSAWRLKTWDRFFIPKPFSTVCFSVGPPHVVNRTSTPAEFEAERLRCEQMMRAQTLEQ